MNKLALALLPLLSSFAVATNPKSAGDIVNIHVSTTRIVPGGPSPACFNF